MNTPVIYDRLAELAFKKIKDELTRKEEQELSDIFEKSPEKKELFEELIDPANMAATLRIIDQLDVGAEWQQYEQEAYASTRALGPDNDKEGIAGDEFSSPPATDK